MTYPKALPQPALAVARGLPASGKTTWARNYTQTFPGALRVNLDDLRQLMFNGVYSSETEFAVQRAEVALVTQSLLLGYTVLVDDTNIQRYKLGQLAAIALLFNVPLYLYDFYTPVATCLARNGERSVGRVPDDRLREMDVILNRNRIEEAVQASLLGKFIVVPVIQDPSAPPATVDS